MLVFKLSKYKAFASTGGCRTATLIGTIIVLLVGPFYAQVHVSQVSHVTCNEHGQIIELASVEGDPHQTEASSHGATLLSTASQGDSHHSEHGCPAYLLSRTGQVQTTVISAALVEPAISNGLVIRRTVVIKDDPLQHAPSHSPPLALS